MNKTVYVMIGFILAVGTIVTLSCNKTKPGLLVQDGGLRSIEHVGGDVKQAATTLESTTASIKESATKGQQATPAGLKPTLDPYWVNILVRAGVQEQVVADLKAKDEDFKKLHIDYTAVTKKANDETARANKAEESGNKAFRSRLHMLVILGIIGIAAGGALVFTGKPAGMAVGVASAILTGVALFVSSTFQLIPWVVGGLVVICVGMAVYYFIRHRKDEEVLVKEKTVLKDKNLKLAEEKEAVTLKLTQEKNYLLKKNTKLAAEKEAIVKQKDEVTNKMLSMVRPPAPEKPRPEDQPKMYKAAPPAPAVKIEDVKALEKRVAAVETKTNSIAVRTQVVEKKVDAAEKTAERTKYFMEGVVAAGHGSRDIWTARAAG